MRTAIKVVIAVAIVVVAVVIIRLLIPPVTVTTCGDTGDAETSSCTTSPAGP